jgi:hypothetical protein
MGNRKVLSCLFVVVLILSISCSNNGDQKLPADIVSNPKTASGDESEKLPAIEFEKDIHDFGKVIQGEKVSFGFKFKNTGNTDLLIAQVNTSCGCTVPKYPKTPIRPGGEDVITILFDSEGRKGVQNKAITVVTNCQPSGTLIRIKAMVIVP